MPLICGGWNGNLIEDCYNPQSATNNPFVKLLNPRSGSASVVMGSQLWITGGIDRSENHTSTTEIVDLFAPAAPVVKGPELPRPMQGHCIAKINETTVLIMYESKTYFFDYEAQVWTDGPDRNIETLDFGCGIMKMANNGSDVVVASGGLILGTEDKTEFLLLDDPDGLKWSPGKKCCNASTRFHGFFFREKKAQIF